MKFAGILSEEEGEEIKEEMRKFRKKFNADVKLRQAAVENLLQD